MNYKLVIPAAIVFVVLGYFYFTSNPVFDFANQPLGAARGRPFTNVEVPQALAAKFEYLSHNGNSSCSLSFRESIPALADGERLIGSCCSPMSMHRYSEQVEGLAKFKSVADQNIPEIPNDPYDIGAGLAKQLMGYYDMELSAEEQMAYDYAMQNSDEKGPCCCKCWRWYVYGGLGKLLIRNYKFTGEQLTHVWNLSDGCGGDADHVHHNT